MYIAAIRGNLGLFSLSLCTRPLCIGEEGVWYRTHHRVVSKEFNYLTTVYTQYTCGFPKISGERRQLYDVCDTRPLPLYAKGAGTETSFQ